MKKLILVISILLSVNVAGYTQSWQNLAQLSGGGITKLDVSPVTGTLFASTASFGYPTGGGAAIYKNIINTIPITQINPEPGVVYIIRTVYCDYRGYVWISFWGDPFNSREKIYLSTDDGLSWIKKDSVGTSNNIFCISVDSTTNNVYIGSRDGVRRSTNSGNTFTLFNNGLPAGEFIRHIETPGDGVVIVSTLKGIYKSINHGENWAVIPGMNQTDTAGAICILRENNTDGSNDSRFFVASNSGSDLKGYTSDFGFAALQLSIWLTGITAFPTQAEAAEGFYPEFGHRSGSTPLSIFVCAYPKVSGNGSVIFSSNGGANWSEINTGLGSLVPIQPSSIAYNKFTGKIYLGYYGNYATGAKLWAMDYSVGVNQISTAVPDNYSLSQNYPNPFNPDTKINFEIKKSSHVKILVYNSTGVVIKELVNENVNTGSYETSFNGEGLSSGVYFYKMFVNGQNEISTTRKMILIK